MSKSDAPLTPFFTPQDVAEFLPIAKARNKRFIELVKLAGLDPAVDLMHADWRGQDFRFANLDGFDFTGADLRGVRHDETTRWKGAILSDQQRRDLGLDEGLTGLEGAQITLVYEDTDDPEVLAQAEKLHYAFFKQGAGHSYGTTEKHLSLKQFLDEAPFEWVPTSDMTIFLLDENAFAPGSQLERYMLTLMHRDDFGLETCQFIFVPRQDPRHRFSTRMQERLGLLGGNSERRL